MCPIHMQVMSYIYVCPIYLYMCVLYICVSYIRVCPIYIYVCRIYMCVIHVTVSLSLETRMCVLSSVWFQMCFLSYVDVVRLCVVKNATT